MNDIYIYILYRYISNYLITFDIGLDDMHVFRYLGLSGMTSHCPWSYHTKRVRPSASTVMLMKFGR